MIFFGPTLTQIHVPGCQGGKPEPLRALVYSWFVTIHGRPEVSFPEHTGMMDDVNSENLPGGKGEMALATQTRSNINMERTLGKSESATYFHMLLT